ncbi:MAG: mechanosensitive ion channel family protein [bacterium]|nr:mechanosensitive ion channel family protein [bacterium]
MNSNFFNKYIALLPTDTSTYTNLIIILIGSYALNYFIRKVFGKINDKASTPKTRTVLQVVQNGVSIIIIIIVILMILSALNINIMPLLASAGIVGFTIGFGSQSLIKDLISGLFLLTGEVFYEGDIVTVSGIEGKVEKVGIRAITIRSLNGVLHTIPNGSITTVANHTKDWARANIDIAVSVEHPIDQILEVLKDEVTALKNDPKFGPWIVGNPKIEGITEITGSKVVIKTLLKTNETKRWDLEREFKYRLKKRFEKDNLKFA